MSERTYLVRAYDNECDYDGFYPANVKAFAEGRLDHKGHQSPVSDTEVFRRFEVSTDGERFYLTEGEPTRAYPLNWSMGRVSRDTAWRMAQRQVLPVIIEARDGSVTDLGVVTDTTLPAHAINGGRIVVSQLEGYKLVQNRPLDCRHSCTCGECYGRKVAYPGTVVRTIHWADNSVETEVACDDGKTRMIQHVGPHGDLCF